MGNDLLLCDEITMHFLDIVLQHLRLAVPQPPEFPLMSGVVRIMMLSADLGGS